MLPTPTRHAVATQASATSTAPAQAQPDAADPDSPPIDSESATLLRCWLQPLIAGASSWVDLNDTLGKHGYALAFREGRLCLTRGPGGACICSMRYLGAGLRELSARLGRPAVRPLPGLSAAGVLCARPRG
ncbi:hypothetical protein [Antarcticimicrobium sediminis]|uniref:Uncharacterized protein n=1 Tax=Antarcticimicrobium sediminis TaxID=2546227 RepID=A0A4R5F1F1_9RHOB|nr:hypothetical protein [Antarcticimicrobium sediminis]TDE41199.1 hypothetical protein E1B25_03130 [Antarcticimicrobium sediminis]